MVDKGLFDQNKVEKLIADIHAAVKEHDCNWLEVAHATKSVLVCACAIMGVNAQDILNEEVKASEMLVVPKEDALD